MDHYKKDDLQEVAEEASMKNSRVESAANLMNKVKSKSNLTDSQKLQGINPKDSHNRIGSDKLDLKNVLESQEFKKHESSDKDN